MGDLDQGFASLDEAVTVTAPDLYCHGGFDANGPLESACS